MCELVGEAVRAGAGGLSLSHLDVDEDLRPVPSRFADLREKIALARAAAEAGGAVLETVPPAGEPDALRATVEELGMISRESGILCMLQPILYYPPRPPPPRRCPISGSRPSPGSSASGSAADASSARPRRAPST